MTVEALVLSELGETCSVDIDECESQPCENGGSCVDLVNSYRCDCLPGYSGETCSVDIDECESQPCENGGSCVDLVNSYRCDCLPGYSGKWMKNGREFEDGKERKSCGGWGPKFLWGLYVTKRCISYSFFRLPDLFT
ncbi:fibropellin-3-like [Ahaetulla prasina]|uniref:fibropellin-3-like n=1 Tax=Ahaetulla prasina TaxID=499056 RepID=UPI002648907C|nr:fibropellin-3-like [Ahaetulla prasina]